MRAEQISGNGVMLNTWNTLENQYNFLNLIGDNNIFINPTGIQFYFDEASELLFIRRTIQPVLISSGDVISDGYAKVTSRGKDYRVKIEKSAVKDSKVGYFHEVVSFDSIAGFAL